MEAKLKINIGPHHLEIEGSEALVQQTYSEFKELVAQAGDISEPSGEDTSVGNGNPAEKEGRKKGKTNKQSKTRRNLERVEVDLRPKGKLSLKDYIAQYASPTKDETYLLTITYLGEELGIKDITVDHVYTCLDELGVRVPTHLKQVITNIKNDRGWIDTSDFASLKPTIKGRNHVKLDMEKA